MPGGEALAPLFFVPAALLVASGASKVLAPEAARRALAGAGLPSPRMGVRGLGAVEVGTGLGGLFWPVPAVAVSMACLYGLFALFLVRVIRSGSPLASCGCLGRREVRPSLLHVGLDMAAVAVSAPAAVVPVPSVAAVAAATPLFGLPFLLGVAGAGYLAYLAAAHLPEAFLAYGGARETRR